MSSTKTPMDLIRQFAPEFAKNQMEEKALLFDHPNYQSIPAKYKTLIGVAVAAALGSEKCTEMWARQAKEMGVTAREITEAIMVARLLKQATVNATAAKTLAWLDESSGDAGA
jgi:AhpD family alkylhydroperoxidase